MIHNQVVWLGKEVTNSTWELATSIPEQLVADYEIEEMQTEVAGQVLHTLCSVAQSEKQLHKKRKIGEDTVTSSTTTRYKITVRQIGYKLLFNSSFISLSNTDLKCNTEKDKSRKLNYTSSGKGN